MPSYRLTFDPAGVPALEEEFSGGPQLDSSLIESPAESARQSGPNWTLSLGASDPEPASSARRAPAPFHFAGEFA